MNVVQSVEHLLHDLLDLAEAELDVDVGEEPGEVVLGKVEDEVERGLVLVGLGRARPADLDQVDNVLVAQELQDLDLAQRRDREALLLVLHQDLLQGYDLGLVLAILGLEHLPEGALTDLGQLLVLGDLRAVLEVVQLDVAVVLGRDGTGAGGAGAGR